jgi:hypothetical protein
MAGKKRSEESKKIIDAAIATGEQFYFTGIPCKRGHVAKRRTSGHMCVQCAKEVYGPNHSQEYTTSENTLYAQYRSRQQVANRLGIPFTIKFEEINTPEFCPVFGSKLEYGASQKINGKQTRNRNKVSLDKLIPELGYVPGNVFVVSWRANNLKSNMTIEELEKILEYMKRNIQNGKTD